MGADRDAVEAALALLDSGAARVAEPGTDGWVVHQWLKQAVLLSFRLYPNAAMGGAGGAPVFDKVRDEVRRLERRPIRCCGHSRGAGCGGPPFRLYRTRRGADAVLS